MNVRMRIDEVLMITANGHNTSGAATDFDSDPTYRIYNSSNTLIDNGTLNQVDSGNTTGYWAVAVTLSTGNGFIAGTSYHVYLEGVVSTITGTNSFGFIVETVASGTVDANIVQVDGANVSSVNDFKATGFSTFDHTLDQVIVTTNNDKSGYLISGTKTTLDNLEDMTFEDTVSAVMDALTVEDISELSAVPTFPTPLSNMIAWIFMKSKNKLVEQETSDQVFKQDDSTVVGTAILNESGSTFTRGKYG